MSAGMELGGPKLYEENLSCGLQDVVSEPYRALTKNSIDNFPSMGLRVIFRISLKKHGKEDG